MGPYNASKLSHSIRPADAYAGCNGAFDGADTFGPDDRIRGASTGDCDNEGQIFDDGVFDSDKNDVADYDCGLDLFLLLV